MKENKRLSRDEFISIMTQLCVINDLIGEMDEAIKKSNQKEENIRIGEAGAFFYGLTKDELVASLLDKIMGSENKDVEYWIFELNYGREYYDGCITWKGESIDVSTPGKLYDYMVERYDNKS